MSDLKGNRLGLVLLILGALVLLSNVGLLGSPGSLLGALLFGVGAALLLRLYRRRQLPWALPAGFVLLGLAAAALTDGPLSGSYFLGFAGAGFVALQRLERRRWWALIPGGVLLTLALVAAVDATSPWFDPGPLLFFGIAATFLVLTRLPEGAQRWAIYPALAALAVGVVALSFTGGWLFPLLLIGAGAWLLRRGRTERGDAPRAPTVSVPPTAPARAATAPATPGTPPGGAPTNAPASGSANAPDGATPASAAAAATSPTPDPAPGPAPAPDPATATAPAPDPAEPRPGDAEPSDPERA